MQGKLRGEFLTRGRVRSLAVQSATKPFNTRLGELAKRMNMEFDPWK
jgi:hypothetical protein